MSEAELSDEKVLQELDQLHGELRDQVIVLGHHYQQDDIIRYADVTGDSLALAREALNSTRRYIMFCGVHFMAETADILKRPDQTVILPDLHAGCSMADMANRQHIDQAWATLQEWTKARIIPVTYINSDAKLKAFVGDHDGVICTSSNAEKIIQWAFEHGEKLLFFPDQHLGRNTCYKMGIPLDQMVTYNPTIWNGGLTPEQVAKAKVILWYGYCSVHQGFTLEQIKRVRAERPETTVIVHPECCFDVTQNADVAGSTNFIINYIRQAPAGASFAVGTEINLVNRLARECPDKTIFSLSPYQCLCTTMYRIRPRWLLASYRAIKAGSPINVIRVDEKIKRSALVALERMLAIS
ncbi:MAG: quinolinate synthetase [Bdellovibrionales bacterium GWA2_49_15]|nr:MAG: quinolinate synthetase [Bdellovibrionales bacterium GWA2_49_15]